jgi:hypothetical protein
VVNSYNTVVAKPDGKKPLKRHGHIKDDNIKMELKETGCEGVDCIHLARIRD